MHSEYIDEPQKDNNEILKLDTLRGESSVTFCPKNLRRGVVDPLRVFIGKIGGSVR